MPRIVIYVIPVVFVVLQLFVYDFFLRTSFFFVYHLHIHVHLFSRLRPPPFITTSSPPYPLYTLACARQCLHLTSLLFLVPDVFHSCCKTYCEFQLLNLLQFRACCCMFLYSRGHSLFGPMNGQAGELPAYILL